MWDLCLYPEFQEELYDMVKDIKDFNNQPAVELFDRVLKESQRLHTIVFAGISRITTQDTVMSGCHVPKDTLIRASYRSVHLNPMYYPSPLEFNPNRWLDPETLSQPFFPFAGGEHAW